MFVYDSDTRDESDPDIGCESEKDHVEGVTVCLHPSLHRDPLNLFSEKSIPGPFLPGLSREEIFSSAGYGKSKFF